MSLNLILVEAYKILRAIINLWQYQQIKTLKSNGMIWTMG